MTGCYRCGRNAHLRVDNLRRELEDVKEVLTELRNEVRLVHHTIETDWIKEAKGPVSDKTPMGVLAEMIFASADDTRDAPESLPPGIITDDCLNPRHIDTGCRPAPAAVGTGRRWHLSSSNNEEGGVDTEAAPIDGNSPPWRALHPTPGDR